MELAKAELVARAWMKHYGLTNWTFSFNTRKRSLGICKYRHGGGSIELNAAWTKTANEFDVLDTIKHECAHALVGPGHGHDNVWKAMCRKIGCAPKARADEDVSGQMDTSGAKFFAQCGSCEQKFHLFRKPKYAVAMCKTCGPELGKITWRPMTPSGTIVQHPRSLVEMGLDKNEIVTLNQFARQHGKQWRETIIDQWAEETAIPAILSLEEKIRPYLNSINFRFHMECDA